MKNYAIIYGLLVVTSVVAFLCLDQIFEREGSSNAVATYIAYALTISLCIGFLGLIIIVAFNRLTAGRASIFDAMIVGITQAAWTIIDGLTLFDVFFPGAFANEYIHRSLIGLIAGYLMPPIILLIAVNIWSSVKTGRGN